MEENKEERLMETILPLNSDFDKKDKELIRKCINEVVDQISEEQRRRKEEMNHHYEL